jgi:hypothetical protein
MPLGQISFTRQLLQVPRGCGVYPKGRKTSQIEIRFIKFCLGLSRNIEELLPAPEVESMPFYELVTSPRHKEIESDVGRKKETVRKKGERI